MGVKSYMEWSKTAWGAEEWPGLDSIKVGCLQRIADATEKMAQSHDALIRARDTYESLLNSSLKENKVLEHRIAGLRGAMGRMKKRK